VTPAPLPDFDVDLGFLARAIDAAARMIMDDGKRRSAIGTGAVKLADRLVIRRDPLGCVYLHRWLRSDPDDLHDHPWDFCSFILAVGYWEITAKGRAWRPPGSIVFRKATERHRVELETDKTFLAQYPGQLPVSIIFTGPERRAWGFHTSRGFVLGRQYRAGQQTNPSRAGDSVPAPAGIATARTEHDDSPAGARALAVAGATAAARPRRSKGIAG
jgi:hypothetical protein